MYKIKMYKNLHSYFVFSTRLLFDAYLIYDDEMILDELLGLYGDLAVGAYINMVKIACDAYDAEYFKEKFILLSQIDSLKISKKDFLCQLKKDCVGIALGQNLGEIKSYVLLQKLVTCT